MWSLEPSVRGQKLFFFSVLYPTSVQGGKKSGQGLPAYLRTPFVGPGDP